jgi:hypothetical protein
VKLPRREDLAQSLRSILESPRLHAPLFLLVALQFAIHRPMSGNEIDTLQAARRFS